MKTGRVVTIVILFAVAGILALFLFNRDNKDNTQSTPSNQSFDNQLEVNEDKHAAFAIFTNGTFRIFTASMYHNLSEDVYITAENPNVVIVKKDGITWSEFFETLPFELTYDCLTTGTKQTFCTNASQSLKFFINGKREDAALGKEIKDRDKLLVTYGSETEDKLDYQFSQIPTP